MAGNHRQFKFSFWEQVYCNSFAINGFINYQIKTSFNFHNCFGAAVLKKYLVPSSLKQKKIRTWEERSDLLLYSNMDSMRTKVVKFGRTSLLGSLYSFIYCFFKNVVSICARTVDWANMQQSKMYQTKANIDRNRAQPKTQSHHHLLWATQCRHTNTTHTLTRTLYHQCPQGNIVPNQQYESSLSGRRVHITTHKRSPLLSNVWSQCNLYSQ